MMTEEEEDEQQQRRKRTHILKDHWSGGPVGVAISTKLLLRILLTFLLIKQIIVYVVLITSHRIDLTMFTYWSYTMLTVYYIVLWFALWLEGWLLTFVCMYLTPIPLVNTFIVSLAIVIVIQLNSSVFTADVDAGKAAMNLIHTGDWILHNLPLVEMLLLHGVGLLLYQRSVVPHELSAIKSTEWRTAYLLYVFLVSLVPLGIYSCVFDITVHYPTSVPTWVLWFGIVLFDLLYMGCWYLAYTVNAEVAIRLISFAPWFNSMSSSSTTTDLERPDKKVDDPPAPATFNNGGRSWVVRSPTVDQLSSPTTTTRVNL